MAGPADFINFIDSNKESFIDRLAKAVEIPGLETLYRIDLRMTDDGLQRLWRSCAPRGCLPHG